MRGWAWVVLLVAGAGCMTQGDELPDGMDVAPTACACPEAVQPPAPAYEVPALEAGLSATYRAELVYNPVEQLTLVVVPNEEGYLFAAAEREHVVTHAVWRERWFGQTPADLSGLWGGNLRFPLTDGASWSPEPDVQAVARFAEVRTPAGAEPGVVIEVTYREKGHMRLDYAPGLGLVAFYEGSWDGAVYDRLTLVATGRASSYVWFEEGPVAEGGSNAPAPSLLQVPEGFDNVLASAGGRGGGRSVIAPPPTALETPWTYEAPQEERWENRILPGTSGAWTLKGHSDEGGFGWMRARAVRWIEDTVG